jgi:hypothetical protein
VSVWRLSLLIPLIQYRVRYHDHRYEVQCRGPRSGIQGRLVRRCSTSLEDHGTVIQDRQPAYSPRLMIEATSKLIQTVRSTVTVLQSPSFPPPPPTCMSRRCTNKPAPRTTPHPPSQTPPKSQSRSSVVCLLRSTCTGSGTTSRPLPVRERASHTNRMASPGTQATACYLQTTSICAHH